MVFVWVPAPWLTTNADAESKFFPSKQITNIFDVSFVGVLIVLLVGVILIEIYVNKISASVL